MTERDTLLPSEMAAISPTTPPTPDPGKDKSFWEKLLKKLQEVALVLIPEGVTLIAVLSLVALSHHLIKSWLGEDAKFLGRLPVSWVFDIGDLIVITYFFVAFIWESIRKFR